MPRKTSSQRVAAILDALCVRIHNRRVGSPGNRDANAFFAERAAAYGWQIERLPFDCLDWAPGPVELRTGDTAWQALPSPYGQGCRVEGPLRVASTRDALHALNADDAILLLRGELTQEPLMPKHYPYYNPEESRAMVALLEEKAPLAIIAATGKHPGLAGGAYPFSLIEDGDFRIPSVYLTDVEGERLATHKGQMTYLRSGAERIPTPSEQVVARRRGDGTGPAAERRLVICAHIDTKPDTPGALDNAAGVAVLLLLAERLANYAGKLTITLVPFNGEDNWSAPGEQAWMAANADHLDEIVLAVNIDAAGYREGRTAWSAYGCEGALAETIEVAMGTQPEFTEGEPWYASDHSVFMQQGRPAMAITSERFAWLSTEITHTQKDRIELVDPAKLVAVTDTLVALIRCLEKTLA